MHFGRQTVCVHSFADDIKIPEEVRLYAKPAFTNLAEEG